MTCVCDKRAITDANVDDLFLVAGLSKHSTPGKEKRDQRTEEIILKTQIRTLDPLRASDPTESNR